MCITGVGRIFRPDILPLRIRLALRAWILQKLSMVSHVQRAEEGAWISRKTAQSYTRSLSERSRVRIARKFKALQREKNSRVLFHLRILDCLLAQGHGLYLNKGTSLIGLAWLDFKLRGKRQVDTALLKGG